MAGPASRNIPTTSNNTLIRNSSSSGFSEIEKIKSVICTGICDNVAIHAKAVAVPTTNKIADEDVAARRKIAAKILELDRLQHKQTEEERVSGSNRCRFGGCETPHPGCRRE